MRGIALTIGVMTLLVELSGCGSNTDRLMDEQVMLLDELADAYESNVPQSTIDEIGKRIAENHKKLDDLKLTDSAKKRLIASHEAELNRATARVAESELKHARRTGKNRDATSGAPGKK